MYVMNNHGVLHFALKKHLFNLLESYYFFFSLLEF